MNKKSKVDLRNTFTHNLFSSNKDIHTLMEEAEKAILLANKVMDEIEIVRTKLEENDPLKIFT